MDKSRDERRKLSRYSADNRINTSKKELVISGNCVEELSVRGAVFKAKLRREKRRRLSFVGRSGDGGCEHDLDTEMVSGKSDVRDEELPSSTLSAKNLKPHKKVFFGSNGVDRASIPRKLRSVIKKRTCQTMSEHMPNSKGHANGLETTRKDCLKKPKSNVFNPEQISKEEVEVAEALFALAGMGPQKATSLENKSDDESLSKRQMHSKKPGDSLLSFQGPQALQEAAQDTCNQSSEVLSNQKMEVNDLEKSTPFSQPKLSQTIFQLNHQSIAKTTSGTKKNDFEQRETLLCQSVYGNASLFGEIGDNYVLPATGDLASRDKHDHASTESKKNGSTMLPSLYSHVSGVDGGFPAQFSSTKLPNWLHTAASSSESGRHLSQVLHKNESEVENRKWIKNRCATHVHISHFIQLSQKPEAKDISFPETPQLRSSEGVRLRFLKAASRLNPVSNVKPTTVCDTHISSPFSEKNISDPSTIIVKTPRRLSHDQEQASLAPGNSNLRNQCFDFLSLSSGGCGTESGVDGYRNRINLDPLAGLPVPQLQPPSRYSSVASLPWPPNLIQLNAYQNQCSTSGQPSMSQVHLPLPPYFSRSYQLDSSSTTSVSKHPQVYQQQPMWMPQQAAHYRTGTVASQIAHWQNSRPEPHISQYTQAQIPSSISSLAPGAHIPKYIQMSQQHHQMLRLSAPFPPVQANGQPGPIPIFCDKIES